LDEFGAARNELLAHQAEHAIPPETRAYRTLRRLVDDIIKGDPKAGNPVVQDKPDKLELKELQHLTRLERARVAWELQTISQELAEVAREQETVNRSFRHFLEGVPQQHEPMKVNDEKSWITDGPPADPADQTPQGAPGPAPTPDRTVEGALAPPAGAMPGAMPVNFHDIMKVLRAQQRQLRSELSRLEAQLLRMPVDRATEDDRPGPAQARAAARGHINQAQADMNRFETLLAEQYYSQSDPKQLLQEAPAILAAIKSELVLARQALQQEAGVYAEDNAQQLRQMALNLMAMANAYEEAVTPEQRRQLLNSLSAVAAQFNAMSGGPANIKGGTPLGQSEPVIAVKGRGDRDIVDAARFAARHFLSKDLDVSKRSNSCVPKTSNGSLKFYDPENDFFESAAQDQAQR